MRRRLRLGVNIDHVATLRNARGGAHPDPLRAAKAAAAAGADLITAHLREDRRHIRDDDIEALLGKIDVPLNLEMAATREMVEIALRRRPHAVCLVPERRRELTTEGGLDVRGGGDRLASAVAALNKAAIRVALFIDPEVESLTAAREIGAPVVELHTGAYCGAKGEAREAELARLAAAAAAAEDLGLECHAGHGLSFETVGAVAAIAQIVELNIGHFLVGEAIFSGFEPAIRSMRERMERSRRVGR